MCRDRVKVTVYRGKTVIMKKHIDFFGRVHSGMVVASELPKHAMSSIRKIAAYKRKLFDAPLHVKQQYSPKQRKRLQKVFTRIEDYKYAIGMI